jgi:hypothetical protein
LPELGRGAEVLGVSGDGFLEEVLVEGRRDRFFDKKHRRFTLCFRHFSGLLGPFWTAILEVNLRVNFALFWTF